MIWELRLSTGETPAYVSASFQDALSDVGSGEVTVDLDHPFWQANLALLDSETVWIARQDGTDRFAWLGEDYDDTYKTDGGVVRTIAGRGLAAELERAIVLPDGYDPTLDDQQTTHKRTFMSVKPMAAWRTLLAEAQNDRGLLSGWSTSFTDTADSDGVSWSRTVDLEFDAGRDLLETLAKLAKQAQCEWHATPNRTLDARQTWRVDKTASVRVYTPLQLSRTRAAKGGAEPIAR